MLASAVCSSLVLSVVFADASESVVWTVIDFESVASPGVNDSVVLSVIDFKSVVSGPIVPTVVGDSMDSSVVEWLISVVGNVWTSEFTVDSVLSDCIEVVSNANVGDVSLCTEVDVVHS